jgi:hypothetical protein
MRHILLGLILVTLSNCFVHKTFSGQILSIVDSLPSPGGEVKINNKEVIISDSSGRFTLSTTKRKIRLSDLSIFPRFDTVLHRRSLTTPVKLYSSVPIDSTLALFDLAHNTIRLLCGGGFNGLGPMPFDKDFETLYSVRYWYLDCVMPSHKELNSYNNVVAGYLDKKYGNERRYKVRGDVHNITRKVDR